uniref:Uncharacterized protein n=1 Tax=Oryza meridionalis TaxID=40149 RepID=A0A0E0C4U9_9ORYZ
ISRRRRQQQQQIAAKNCTRSQLPTAGQVVADLSSRSRRFRASRARAGHRAVVNEQRRLRLEASGRAATSQNGEDTLGALLDCFYIYSVSCGCGYHLPQHIASSFLC